MSTKEQIRTTVLRGEKYCGSREISPFSLPTQREVQVLMYQAMGLTNDEIARKLGISWRTVKNHNNTLHKRLNVGTRGELGAIFWHSLSALSRSKPEFTLEDLQATLIQQAKNPDKNDLTAAATRVGKLFEDSKGS